jgi:hypothetical protein
MNFLFWKHILVILFILIQCTPSLMFYKQSEFVFSDFFQCNERHFNGDGDQIVMLSM